MSAGPPPVLPAASSPSTRDARASSTPPTPAAGSGGGGPRRPGRAVLARPVAIAAAVVVIVTLLAATLSAIDPALAPGGHPHPTLHGTLREARGILAENARLLIVPLLLVAGRWPAGRLTRHLGDLVVALLLVVNAAAIGVALGRFGYPLLAYLPHLPLEDAALASAAGAWLSRRLPHPPATPLRSVSSYAIWTLLLSGAAALVETFLVPHAS